MFLFTNTPLVLNFQKVSQKRALPATKEGDVAVLTLHEEQYEMSII
ncbi:hypothetical protein HMPREF1870_00469 [Bacteroidales bacterium KA00344]|nr:hypothetical protein HMPREF1870_00469 [Bacteroidales bacterium KA00344]